jgi:hypothetical protein
MLIRRIPTVALVRPVRFVSAADMWRAQAEDRGSGSDDGVSDEAETDSVLVEPLPALSGRAMRHRG